jgi:beta-aspartyl-dipeptidase (metallo-type)
VITLIRNANVFSPAPRGVCDVAVVGGRVAEVAPRIELTGSLVRSVDGTGLRLVPGFIDVLTHPAGGGGEGGAGNRTPEVPADEFMRGGITTPVGALGTDSILRGLETLYGSVMSLRAAGLRAMMYSGSYRVPPLTLTGDIARDMVLIEPVLGIGELAVSDHRSSQPTVEELRRVAAEVGLGGTLSGKQGVVFVHVGDGPGKLEPLRAALAGSDLPPRLFYPTHCNRNRELLAEAFDLARGGSCIDLTATTTPEFIAQGEVTVLDALRLAQDEGVPLERITFSTDAGGSLPHYENGVLLGLQAAGAGALLEAVQGAAADAALFPLALAAVTCNPARALGLEGLGAVEAGAHADLLLLQEEGLAIQAVMCGGQWLLDPAH